MNATVGPRAAPHVKRPPCSGSRKLPRASEAGSDFAHVYKRSDTDHTCNGAGGAELFYQSWLPDGTLRGVVLAQHGHGDHSGGLINLVEALLAHGYAVYAPDLRGHGRSPGARGGLRDWSQYRQDLHAIRTRVAAQHPDLPLFLLGHSLGGVVVLEYVLHHGQGLAGAIAIAPAISYEPTRGERWLMQLLGPLAPGIAVTEQADYSQLTRDPAVVTRLQADSLRHGTKTVGLGRGLMAAVPTIMARAGEFPLPLLLIAGLADPITPPAKLRDFFAAVGTADKEWREYAELRHRPFDELGREQVLADLTAWLAQHS